MDAEKKVPESRPGLEKALLAVVLLIVGGALGDAAYLASGGRTVPDEPPRGDVALVSRGDEVDLEAKAVPGKYTIFDFYADWCAPCRALDVRLRALAAERDDVAIRKIDIIDWTTPVVKQHGVEGLPFMILYGPDGKRLAAGDEVYLTVDRIFSIHL